MQKLSDTSDKKIRIIHQNGKSVSEPLAPKKGIVFSLFNFSRAQTPGENTTTVLSKLVPEILRPGTPRADLKAVKSWIALEEKVVHDYTEQKKAQPKSAVPLSTTPRLDILRADLAAIKNRVALEKKVVRDYQEQKTAQSKSVVPLPKTPRPDLLRNGLTAVRNWISSWEKAVRNGKEQQKAQPKSAVPSLTTPRLDVLRADLAAVKNWVALEEKIVHNDKKQQTPHSENAVPLPIPPRPDTSRADLTTIKNRIALEEKVVLDHKEQKKEQKTAQPKSVVSLPKTPRPDLLQTGFAVVRNWVSLGEKFVRDYKAQKTTQPKSVVSLPKTPEKQSLPVFETFSMQAAVSSAPHIPKLKDPLRGSERISLKLRKFLLVLGWLTAGVLVFLYIQEAFLNREVLQKLSQLKNEKNLLEQSYVALQNVWENQRAEIKSLNSELQDTILELKTAKSEIDTLQNTVQTQNAIIRALKAQSQAFEKIIDQGGLSALSGAAAGFSSGQFLTGRTPISQGEITSVNDRRGFVVINMGANQGAYPGRWITISRNDRELAVGRIDRVYPTMSVAVLRSSGMLQVVQEGDRVFFS
ncbi:MAG: hypothetical protein ABH891_04995 [Candidatus Omnitrophota bacterium]